jgi:CBS domain-containing protein
MNIHYAIHEFMATNLITFSPETPIETAIDTFLTQKISGAPVVNSEGYLV